MAERRRRSGEATERGREGGTGGRKTAPTSLSMPIAAVAKVEIPLSLFFRCFPPLFLPIFIRPFLASHTNLSLTLSLPRPFISAS